MVVPIIAPVFFIILIGFLSRRLALVGPNLDKVTSDLVFKLVIPIFLFELIATSDLKGVNPWTIWLGYLVPVAIVWTCAALLIPLIFRRAAVYGVASGVTASYANTVLLGIPLVSHAFGEAAMIALGTVIAIHTPIMFLAAMLHHHGALANHGFLEKERTGWLQETQHLASTFLANPIIIGIASGGLVRLSGFTLPDFLVHALSLLAVVAGPLALFVLGMGLSRYGLRGHIGPALLISALKLILHPLLVFLLSAHVLFLPPLLTAGLVLAAATPSGINTYFFANHFNSGEALTASTIIVTTGFSLITLPVWLFILTLYLEG